MEGSEAKKYDINIAVKLISSAILLGIVALAESSGVEKSKEEKFRLKDIRYKGLITHHSPRYNDRWILMEYDSASSQWLPRYDILRAETFDGDVDQKDIRNINDDGDSFNLTINGTTRHAKYLICAPYNHRA